MVETCARYYYLGMSFKNRTALLVLADGLKRRQLFALLVGACEHMVIYAACSTKRPVPHGDAGK